MSNTISLTLPRNDEEALVAGATLLLTLAGKVPVMELPEMRDPCVGCGGATGVREYRFEGTDGVEVGDVVVLAETTALSKQETPPPPGDEEPDDTNLDADGLPWDARIHSGGKSKLADGTWRKRKGVDPEDYDRVVEELRQLMAVPVAGAESGLFYWIHPESESYGIETTRANLHAVLAADGMAQEVSEDQYDEKVREWSNPGAVPPPPPVGQPAAEDVPPPPPVVEQPEAVAPPVEASADGTPATFTEFLKAVSHKIQNKELTMADVNGALPDGVANLHLLSGRPDLIPQVWSALVAKR